MAISDRLNFSWTACRKMLKYPCPTKLSQHWHYHIGFVKTPFPIWFRMDLSKKKKNPFTKSCEGLGGQVVIAGFMKFSSCFAMDKFKGLVMVRSSPNSELIFKIIASKVVKQQY